MRWHKTAYLLEDYVMFVNIIIHLVCSYAPYALTESRVRIMWWLGWRFPNFSLSKHWGGGQHVFHITSHVLPDIFNISIFVSWEKIEYLSTCFHFPVTLPVVFFILIFLFTENAARFVHFQGVSPLFFISCCLLFV